MDALQEYISSIDPVRLSHDQVLNWAIELERRCLETWSILVDCPNLKTLTYEAGVDFKAVIHGDVTGDHLEKMIDVADVGLENRLAKSWAKALVARDTIVRSHLLLVIKIANRYPKRRLSKMDLIQEGNMGLIKATYRFDHRKGFRFSTYATHWIRHHIGRAIVNTGLEVRLPAGQYQAQTKIRQASQARMARQGDVTREQIAKDTGLKLKQIDRLCGITRPPVQLDHPPSADTTDHLSLHELIPCNGPSSEDKYAEAEQEHRVRQVLVSGLLNDRERFIMYQRFYEGKTLDEIGTMLSRSRERVRQIEKVALTKLRKALT